ncbi:hypothetical protein JCM3774_001103 [Rhodotorula dairenensis]
MLSPRRLTVPVQTRLATIRHCAAKLPLLFLLWLLCPQSTPTLPTQAQSKALARTPSRIFPGGTSGGGVGGEAKAPAPSSLPRPTGLPHAEQLASDIGDNGLSVVLPAQPARDEKRTVGPLNSRVASDVDSERREQVPPGPSHLKPLHWTLCVLLGLSTLIRPLLLTADESLTRSVLADPFPSPPPGLSLPTLFPRLSGHDVSTSCPASAPHSQNSPPPPPNWSKRFSRLHWRLQATWRRCGYSLFVLFATSMLLIAVLVSDAVAPLDSAREQEQGWNVVAGRWLIRRLGLRLTTTGGLAATARGARGWKPLRNVVWLEILDALACAFHGLLPLLLHFRLVPPTLSGDFLRTEGPTLAARESPGAHSHVLHPLRLCFPTAYLVSSFYLPILSHALTLVQILQLVLARSPLTHKWFGFTTGTALFIAITVPLDAIAVIKERATREAERLLEVGQTFATPTTPHSVAREVAAKTVTGEAVGVAMRTGSRDPEAKEEEEEGDWICSICLAGQTDRRMGVISFETPCRLPCAHSFHAHCLATWFSTVSSCPTCHRAVVRSALSVPGLDVVPATVQSSAPALAAASSNAAAAVAATMTTTTTSSPFPPTSNIEPDEAAAASSPMAAEEAAASSPYFSRDAFDRARVDLAAHEQRRYVDQYPGAAAAAMRARRRRTGFPGDGTLGDNGDAVGQQDQGHLRDSRSIADLSTIQDQSRSA